MYTTIRLASLLSACIMTISATTNAADSPPSANAPVEVDGAAHVRTIEGISEYRLENGMQVLLFPDHSKPTVTVNMTVLVGSRHEGYGESGMAHLLEHMLFKGTPDHPQIPKALQERGANFNGTTWVDRTNYYETLPASDANLEFAIRLEADRLINSFVRKEDLDSEMTVVRNEFEQGENSPARILSQRMLATAYEWHNYGKSTIGNRADIERVPIENLKDFYKRYYQPDNAMLVVSGQFDPEKALEIVVDSFGKIPAPERKLPSTYTEEPAQDGERVVTLRRVGNLPIVGAAYHIPAGSHESYAAIDVLESLLTSAPSGRLYKKLVETKLAASVSGAAFAWHDPGLTRFMAELNAGSDPQQVLTLMVETIESVGESGATEEEVERAKRKLLKQRELTAANSTEIAVELSEWAAMGDWRLYFLYRDRLEQVTPEKVNEVARNFFKRQNRTVGIFIPTEKPLTTPIPQPPEDLAAAIGDYQGREGAAAGETFEVTPENIEKRTTITQLPSGFKVALLPKQNRGGSVVARLNLRYGSVESLKGLSAAGEILPNLMGRGTKSKTRQQIQDELDRLGAQLVASGTPGVATFAVQAKRETLPEVLEILKEILREATLPAEELELLKQSQVAAYERQLTDPQSLAMTAVRQAIAPYEAGDPRYVPSLAEHSKMFQELKREDVERLYKDFLNGQHGELVIVGDFDVDPTVELAKKVFADWDSKIEFIHLEQLVPKNLADKSKTINTPGKENATYFAATVVPLASDHPDYAALAIGDYILGAGALSSRLGDRIRQQAGLSYGVGSGFNAQDLDPRAVLYVYAITNPENMEKVKTAIREELDRLLADGVTEAELAAAKQGYLQELQVARADDARLAQTLAENMRADRTMEYHAKLQETINNLTPEQVLDALKKHIDPESFVIVAAGDFEKVKSTEESQ